MTGETGDQTAPVEQKQQPLHLYASLNITVFPMWFRNDAIRISSGDNIQDPRLTSDWDTARVYADFASGSPGAFCLMEATGKILDRNRIHKRELTPPNLKGDRRAATEYVGDDDISWREVERIFVAPEALVEIRKAHREARGVTKWETIDGKFVVVKDPRTEEGWRKLRDLIKPRWMC